jgi:predicted RND superfamily exporter protein
MASTVSHALEQSNFVSRVSSPATARLLVPSTDLGLDARQFVVDGKAISSPDLVRAALVDPFWSRTLVSEDGRIGAIVVELSSTESDALSGVVHGIRLAIAPFAATDFHFHVVGEAVTFVAAQEAGLESALRAGIGTGSMLFVGLLVLLRSLTAVLASLVTIGVASAWTMGLLPLLGWQQSELTNGAATLILVIGCADCVHFVAHYLEVRAQFEDRATALEATSRWVLAPCFLTTATTVGSFASFATGEVLALTQFGVMAAIGITAAFLLTFSLFPALLSILPARTRPRQYSAAWQEILRRISRFGTRRRWLVLNLSMALALLGIAGIPKLRIEMNVTELWGPDHPMTRAMDFVSEHLQRVDRLEIELVLPESSPVEDPSTLESIAAIEERVGGVEGVGRAQSLVTLLRHFNSLLRTAGEKPASLPDSEAAIAELLFIVSSSPGGALDPWLTLDQRRTRLSFEVQPLSMQEKVRTLSEIEDVLRSSVPRGWSYTITGPVALTSHYGEEFGRSQTNIVSISSLLVFAMIGAYLRSVPWALLALVPNAVALLLLFGAMGHWGILLNFGSAIVAPIAIGIAADDTIHFLTAYSRERRSGKDAIQALQGAISGVGEAVIATAIALSLGFLSMTTSPMASVADMGLLCAVAILGATVADLLILPALISTVAEWRGFQGLPGRHE